MHHMKNSCFLRFYMSYLRITWLELSEMSRHINGRAVCFLILAKSLWLQVTETAKNSYKFIFVWFSLPLLFFFQDSGQPMICVPPSHLESSHDPSAVPSDFCRLEYVQRYDYILYSPLFVPKPLLVNENAVFISKVP